MEAWEVFVSGDEIVEVRFVSAPALGGADFRQQESAAVGAQWCVEAAKDYRTGEPRRRPARFFWLTRVLLCLAALAAGFLIVWLLGR